jgi:hypothetical protein
LGTSTIHYMCADTLVMKMKYTLLCFLILLSGCVESPTQEKAVFDDIISEDIIDGDISEIVEDTFVPPPTVGITLRIGHFTASGFFIEKPEEVSVPTGGGWGYTQVAAKLDVPEEFKVDFLRVMFTSDRVEWLATDMSGSTTVFLDEELCLDTGLQCNDIVPGTSESGYFETGGSFDERLAITNVHCSPTELPYELTITAFVVDICYPLAVIASEEAHITINCVQKD